MSFLTRKHSAYKEAFKSPDGQFLLASLLDFTGFYKQSFAGDHCQTAFNEGKRAVALHIIQQLDLREEDLRQMVRDYRTELFNQEG